MGRIVSEVPWHPIFLAGRTPLLLRCFHRWSVRGCTIVISFSASGPIPSPRTKQPFAFSTSEEDPLFLDPLAGQR